MTRPLFAAVLSGALLAACGSPPPPPDATTAPHLPLAEPNDNTESIGALVGDTLLVELDLVEAAWTPRGENGPRLPIAAFAPAGGAPRVPGPLIRATHGQFVRIIVNNTLDRAARFNSPLLGEGGSSTTEIKGGASGSLLVFPERPVASIYRASVPGFGRIQGATSGVIVIDPENGPEYSDERIFHLVSWGNRSEPGSLDALYGWKQTINGRSWPHTERLRYATGDSVRWRVVNSSQVRHPMHLHGFFFDVTSTGDLRTDSPVPVSNRKPVVTHVMLNESSMRLEWIPSEPGNWLFHCHLIRHMGETQTFVAEDTDMSDGDMRGMAGLIMGISIDPGPEYQAVDQTPERRIGLWASAVVSGYESGPRLLFVQQESDEPPPDDIERMHSSTLVLERDEPTEIVVHNRLESPLSVHWHGLELKSLFDGVGGWSGPPGAERGPIAPGDSVRVLLQPPRSGTFMYHTHGETGHELAQGLYGGLIVVDDREQFDPDTDRVFMLGSGGAVHEAPPAVNGSLEPVPMRFESGRTYRLRFGQISPDESKIVRIVQDGDPVTWVQVAKDGAELDEIHRQPTTADVRMEVGETYDFEWSPEQDGIYTMQITTVRYPLDASSGGVQTIALGVGDVSEDALLAANAAYDPPMSRRTEALIFWGIAFLVLVLLVSAILWILRKVWRSVRARIARRNVI